ncbi:MAG: J domain-containing protein [Bacteroidia bacterium]|nr:J domain-containing protein [Bacteroidia bacterium]
MTSRYVHNYCTILGINEDAGINDIKKAYRKKAKEYHPDLNKAPGAHFQFIIINEAYSFLLRVINENRSLKDFNSFVYRKPNQNPQSKTYYSREEWIHHERAKARARAAYYAQMKFNEFKKTTVYKTSRVVSEIFDYIYFVAGILIITVPIVYTSIHGIDPHYFGRTIGAIIGAVTIGLIISGMIAMTKLEKIKTIFKKDINETTPKTY